MPAASIRVRVTPRSSRNEVSCDAECLKVRVTAAPADGGANRAVLEILSKVLGVSKTALSIESGLTSREKRIRVDGLERDEVWRRLDRHAPAGRGV